MLFLFFPEQMVMNISLAWRLNFLFLDWPRNGVGRFTWENVMGKLRLQRNPSCPVEHLAIPGQEHSSIYKSFISIVYLKTKPQISSRGFPALNCFHQALFKVKTLKLPGRAFLNFLCCFFFFYRGYRHHVQK